MHSVQRSPDPAFLARLHSAYTRWEDLDGNDRRRIRDALALDFKEICAYCERLCGVSGPFGHSSNRATIDHFHPRVHFPDLWLDWPNLMYACHRCNQAKGGKWPGHDDQLVNERLETLTGGRYRRVSQYVNPNALAGQRPVSEFFSFNFEGGEMAPAERLDLEEWSMARRTILDIDLNDSKTSRNDPSQLCNRRLHWLNLVKQQLEQLPDIDAQVWIMRTFSQPDKPYSSFVSAFLAGDSSSGSTPPLVD